MIRSAPMKSPQIIDVTFDDKAITKSVEQYDGFVDEVRTVTVTTEDDYTLAGALLVEMRKKVKSLEAERDTIIKPLNEALKRLRGLYKPTLDSLTAAENVMKSLMSQYRAKEQLLQMRLQEKAQKLLKSGHVAKAMVLVEKVNQEPAKAVGVSVRKLWRLRVTDSSKVPDQFYVISESALLDDAKSRGWANPPPGVEYFTEDSTSIRTK